jgi:hypothetical protein
MSEQNLDQTHIGVLLEQVRGKAVSIIPPTALAA